MTSPGAAPAPARWIAALEAALNRLLRLDPEFADGLGPLAGATVRVSLEPRGPTLVATLTADGVRLRERADRGAPDVELSGDLAALLALLEDPAALPPGVRVTGDLAVLQSLRRHLARLQIDWEEALARRIGDVPGHQAARAARAAFGWGREASATVAADVAEFLVEEARWLPARWPVEQFYDQVDVLRDDVERLEQRIERLRRAGEKPR